MTKGEAQTVTKAKRIKELESALTRFIDFYNLPWREYRRKYRSRKSQDEEMRILNVAERAMRGRWHRTSEK